MNKKIRIYTIILLILLIIYIPVSYAFEGKIDFSSNDEQINDIEEQKASFFEVDNTEKEVGSILNMYINISNIEYENFKFKLTSSINIGNLDIEKNESNDEIQIEKNDNTFYLIINKGELNIQQLSLNYTIPNNLSVGDKFTLTGEIIKCSDNQDEQESKQELIEIKIVEKKNEESEEENKNKQETADEKTNELNKQENTQNQGNIQNQENTQNQGNTQNQENIQKQENLQNQGNTQNKENTTAENKTIANIIQKSSSTNTGSNYSNNLTTTVTYKGSENNYLKEILIDGYELNTEFSKDNGTYFLNVENEITSLNITATEEDSLSKVCIYGNNDLKEGKNKILISVTAENGNVRTYRIYVTRKSI